jgi:hypothetical protein
MIFVPISHAIGKFGEYNTSTFASRASSNRKINAMVGIRCAELSKITGVPARTLRRLAVMGIIPSKRLPGNDRAHFRFPPSSIPEIKVILTNAGLMDESNESGKNKT